MGSYIGVQSGPGRETANRPGWSMPVRARPAGEGREGNPLLQPAAARALAALLQALTPFPEARAAAAAALGEAAPLHERGDRG